MTRSSWERLWTAAALAAVVWLYGWTLAAVGGMAPPTRSAAPNDYYNHLVAGFLQGHLYMDLPVSDGLKALSDPYDPAQNQPYRLTDASYYKGHYYLYFGATPAVTLLLPFRVITGQYLPTPTAIFIFSVIGFGAAAGIWLALRRRYFADAPIWTAPIGVLVIGVGCTASVLLRRPFFWELATAGGFAFAMLAVVAVYNAIHCERHTPAWMFAAGLLLGLAVASRPTYVYAIPMLAAPLLACGQLDGITPRWWRLAIAAAVGIGVMGVATFAYNAARFGSGLEFGHNYLLSVAYESKVRLFGWDHFWFNTRMYFLLPGTWSWRPPFFSPVPVTRAEMPAAFYTVDDPFGLIRVFPIVLVALMAPFALGRRTRQERVRLRSILLAFFLLFATAAVVILLYVATIPRYAVDFFPALMLLVAVGLLAAVKVSGPAVRAALATIAVASVAVGTLTLFDVGHLLSQGHPATLDRVLALTTRLEALQDRLQRIHYGPVRLQVRLPEQGGGRTETLLTAGPATVPDRVLIQYLVAQRIRIGLEHAGAPIEWSAPLSYRPDKAHEIAVELGSFYPPLEHRLLAGLPYEQATALQHHFEFTFDGKAVLQGFAPFEPSRCGAPRAAAPGFTGKLEALQSQSPALDPHRFDLGPRQSPGGVLRLRVMMPHGIKGTWLPVLCTGRSGAADTLSINYMGADVIQFRYDHWAAPLVIGASVPINEAVGHDLEIYFPSFRTGAFGQAAEGEVWVRLDGKEVLRDKAAAYGFRPDEFYLGENGVGAALVDRYFRGAFDRREWVHAE